MSGLPGGQFDEQLSTVPGRLAVSLRTLRNVIDRSSGRLLTPRSRGRALQHCGRDGGERQVGGRRTTTLWTDRCQVELQYATHFASGLRFGLHRMVCAARRGMASST
jgi:hypothetical protein